MNLQTESYLSQHKHWPTSGRHILAHFDEETIVVYQAYSLAIGRFAIQYGKFGGDFKYSRMSWIKPNFLWMMYRSSWGQAQGQEVVLGIRLRRPFFDSLLNAAVPSSFSSACFSDEAAWQSAVAQSDVRLQWDPDHMPNGEKCERRAVQLGLRGTALDAYGKQEIIEIIDMSAFVDQQRSNIEIWKEGVLMTPMESVYTPTDPSTASHIGLDHWTAKTPKGDD